MRRNLCSLIIALHSLSPRFLAKQRLPTRLRQWTRIPTTTYGIIELPHSQARRLPCLSNSWTSSLPGSKAINRTPILSWAAQLPLSSLESRVTTWISIACSRKVSVVPRWSSEIKSASIQARSRLWSASVRHRVAVHHHCRWISNSAH